ncbi:tetratricopeptide repeat protein [Paraburkholderia tropica]|uniref:tetratricopeptide repeat protein n=1 Tax=Paraburkholderia tropica TaxID=92647 RepID=UPI002ABD9096|nr:tetratricopeptide repeat protein [Paraburkholderia tropica]
MRRKAARREAGALGLTALCAAVAALATFAGQPGTAAALPAPPRAASAAWLAGSGFPALDAVRVVDDPTTPCVLMLDYRAWAASLFDKPKDERARCMLEAANGNLSARAIYGQMVAYGYGGPRETDRGLAMLESAALDGSVLARRMLGNLYRDGSVVPADLPGARRWFESAAAQGDAISADVLGAMSANGEGQPVDNEKAYRYFVQAAEAGSANGAANAAQFAAIRRHRARRAARSRTRGFVDDPRRNRRRSARATAARPRAAAGQRRAA